MIAVVGAGVVGVACARALQVAGHAVTLFDPAPPGSGVSAGNAGHIAVDHVRPLARPDVLAGVPGMLASPLGPLVLRWRGVPRVSPWLARFALAARPGRVRAGTTALAGLLGSALGEWQALLAGAGLSEMLVARGALNVLETTRGIAAAAAEGAVQRAHGLTFEDLPGAAVRDMLPGLVRVPAGGRLFPRSAHVVNPLRLVQALAARVVADGGALVAAGVTGVRREGARVVAVVTDQGEMAVDGIVVATGAASPALGRMLGVRLPLTTERGYHAMLAPGALDVALPVSFVERGFVVTPMEHGIRLAGTVELGAGRRGPDWARADVLGTQVRALFGADVAVTERWMGDRPTLPDYLPALGLVGPNVVMAAGHQHLGLTLAAATGRVVVALMAGVAPAVDVRAFDPGRFGRVEGAGLEHHPINLAHTIG